jgi:23S rRNA (pseudouridine1915-N3)-methyltransferase
MRITVLSVGKLKEKYLQQGIGEYHKRLTPYCKLKMTEVNDEREPDQVSDEALAQVKQKEGDRLLRHTKADQYVIALDITGQSWYSERFAHALEQLCTYGKSDIVFIIGGSNGLSPEVLERADLRLSFSKMTFPHQLMRLILLEQIYRSFKIIKGEPYHK